LTILFTSYRDHRAIHSFPTRRSSDLAGTTPIYRSFHPGLVTNDANHRWLPDLTMQENMAGNSILEGIVMCAPLSAREIESDAVRSEEHTSELQSRFDLVCRLLLEKKK